jgi:hypothetical protein
VRDWDQLTAQGSNARTTATDFTATMNGLRRRQAEADQQLAKAEEIAAEVEVIEQDPIAWFSQLQERMPHLRRELGW